MRVRVTPPICRAVDVSELAEVRPYINKNTGDKDCLLDFGSGRCAHLSSLHGRQYITESGEFLDHDQFVEILLKEGLI